MADPLITASSRLAGDWSAPGFAKALTPALVGALAERFDALDPPVRVRLLLACAHAPAAARAEMAKELKKLSAAARADKEEWVSAIGAALGDFGGAFDVRAAARASAALRDALAALESAARAAACAGPAPGFRPLEERYLTPRLRAAARGAGGGGGGDGGGCTHFTVRPGGAPPLPVPVAAAPQPPPAAAAAAPAGDGLLSPPPPVVQAVANPAAPLAPPPPPLAPATSAGGERRGVARAVKAKLLDVGEVAALRAAARPAGRGGGGAGAPPAPDAKEDGELEEGELPTPRGEGEEDGVQPPAAKRPRGGGGRGGALLGAPRPSLPPSWRDLDAPDAAPHALDYDYE